MYPKKYKLKLPKSVREPFNMENLSDKDRMLLFGEPCKNSFMNTSEFKDKSSKENE
jgi:hypothetical protein